MDISQKNSYELNKELTSWLIEYNLYRPQQSFNSLTSLEFTQKEILESQKTLIDTPCQSNL
jgi:hypothetical protein